MAVPRRRASDCPVTFWARGRRWGIRGGRLRLGGEVDTVGAGSTVGGDQRMRSLPPLTIHSMATVRMSIPSLVMTSVRRRSANGFKELLRYAAVHGIAEHIPITCRRLTMGSRVWLSPGSAGETGPNANAGDSHIRISGG